MPVDYTLGLVGVWLMIWIVWMLINAERNALAISGARSHTSQQISGPGGRANSKGEQPLMLCGTPPLLPAPLYRVPF